jgi:chromosome segregation ATPase
MKNYKVILIAFLLGVTVFSVFKYVLTLREKNDLLIALDKLKEQEAALLNEKQNLLETLEKQRWLKKKLIDENSIVHGNLISTKEKLAKLYEDLTQARETIGELNTQISSLQAKNTTVRQEMDKLNIQLTQVIQEKDALKTRLNSIEELKKAIKELKRQMRKVSVESKDMVEVKNKTGQPTTGNRGFFVKAGKSTYPVKAKKIEVNLIVPPIP